MICLGTVEGAMILLNSISIKPCVSATIHYTLTAPDGSIKELTHIVEGEQYARWGTDDTIIYHLLCAKHKLHYKPYEPEFFEEIMVSSNQETGEMKYETIRYPNPKYNPNAPEYKPVEFPTSSIVYESADNRSVHNEADIQRIQTLQEQLDAQAAKLKTITELLFKNGAL